MLALGGNAVTTIFVIAMVAHAHCVDGKVDMLAVCDSSLLPARFASSDTTWLLAVVRMRTVSCGDCAHELFLLFRLNDVREARLVIHPRHLTAVLCTYLGGWTVLDAIWADAAGLARSD